MRERKKLRIEIEAVEKVAGQLWTYTAVIWVDEQQRGYIHYSSPAPGDMELLKDYIGLERIQWEDPDGKEK